MREQRAAAFDRLDHEAHGIEGHAGAREGGAHRGGDLARTGVERGEREERGEERSHHAASPSASAMARPASQSIANSASPIT